MRFAPAAAALSLFLATTASVSYAVSEDPAPRAAMLIAQGQAALAADDPQAAIDALEAALAVDPAHTPILLELAKVARAQGLQGKAIRYYRDALEREPGNFAAIAAQGEAFVEKGALENAQQNLAKLQAMCGDECSETLALQSTIAMNTSSRLAVETPPSDTASN